MQREDVAVLGLRTEHVVSALVRARDLPGGPIADALIVASCTAGDALPIEQVASRWIVASDPDDAIEQVKAYVDAGLEHLVFHAPGEDQERFLTAFAEQVMPGLRSL